MATAVVSAHLPREILHCSPRNSPAVLEPSLFLLREHRKFLRSPPTGNPELPSSSILRLLQFAQAGLPSRRSPSKRRGQPTGGHFGLLRYTASRNNRQGVKARVHVVRFIGRVMRMTPSVHIHQLLPCKCNSGFFLLSRCWDYPRDCTRSSLFTDFLLRVSFRPVPFRAALKVRSFPRTKMATALAIAEIIS